MAVCYSDQSTKKENNCQAINNFSHAKKEVRKCHSAPNHIIYQVFEVGYIYTHDKFINYFIRLWHHLYVYIKTYDRKICDQLAFNCKMLCKNFKITYHNSLKAFLWQI